MMVYYKNCLRCGGSLARRGNKSDFPKCRKCGFIFYPTIKLTASVIVENEKGEILFLRRKHPPYKGLWNTPGGHVNPGESAERACLRELFEETGLRVKRLEYTGSYPDKYKDQGATHPLLAISFLARVSSRMKVKAGDDAFLYSYFPKNKIPWDKMGFRSDIAALKDHLKRKPRLNGGIR